MFDKYHNETGILFEDIVKAKRHTRTVQTPLVESIS
jgi:hypothetical protein